MMDRLESGLEVGAGVLDERQEEVRSELMSLRDDLLLRGRYRRSSRGLKFFWEGMKRMGGAERRRQVDEVGGGGVYLHGGVGRGKTMLMDMFFGSLPEGEGKKRFHYHDFMGKVHEGFTVLRKGGEDGLAMEEVVDGLLGGECSVLCLDEMEIVDITDAMIIRRVFEVIVSRRISLVMTSNVAPVDLYKHGLQRELFEPFIDVLVGYVDVMDLGGDKDYRLVGEEREALCFVRGEEGLLESVYEGWDFCEGIDEVYLGLSSRGRGLLAKRRDGDKVWLKFDDVCGGFLGSRDYVKLSREFGKFVIEGVPKMSDVGIDRVRRFVMLIDVLYEERVSLALLLDGDLSLREVMMLEEGDRYGLGRAYSRLEEMLSGGYG